MAGLRFSTHARNKKHLTSLDAFRAHPNSCRSKTQPQDELKADPRQVASVEELLRAVLYEQEALQRVLVRKGLVSNEEVLEEVEAVRQELEGERGVRGFPATILPPYDA